MLYAKSGLAIIGYEISWKLVVKMKLIIGEQANNRPNAERPDLIDPSIDVGFRDALRSFARISRALTAR